MIELKSSEGKELSAPSISLMVEEETIEVAESENLKELGAKVLPGKPFALQFENDAALFMPVESSNIGHIHWSHNGLFLTFKAKGGFSLYGYGSVGKELAMRLVNAESIGKEFHKVKGDLGEYVRFF